MKRWKLPLTYLLLKTRTGKVYSSNLAISHQVNLYLRVMSQIITSQLIMIVILIVDNVNNSTCTFGEFIAYSIIRLTPKSKF